MAWIIDCAACVISACHGRRRRHGQAHLTSQLWNWCTLDSDHSLGSVLFAPILLHFAGPQTGVASTLTDSHHHTHSTKNKTKHRLNVEVLLMVQVQHMWISVISDVKECFYPCVLGAYGTSSKIHEIHDCPPPHPSHWWKPAFFISWQDGLLWVLYVVGWIIGWLVVWLVDWLDWWLSGWRWSPPPPPAPPFFSWTHSKEEHACCFSCLEGIRTHGCSKHM